MKNNTSLNHFTALRLMILISFWLWSAGPTAGETIRPGVIGECTIGVFGPEITADGRPILWKNRDVTNFDQKFVYYGSYQRDGISTIPFMGNVYRADTTRVYMGVNQAGFAIGNADSFNLEDSLYNQGIVDGVLMRLALESCRTLRDFEALLDSTNNIGRESCWNFAVFATDGRCAMYECANYSYLKFTLEDTERVNQGFMIRANYSLSGGNLFEGRGRFKQAVALTESRLQSEPIDVAFVLQDLARDLHNSIENPYPLPYNGNQGGAPPGYIYVQQVTISNKWTSSAVVIRGTRPEEDRSLATTFAMLGTPVLTAAYPLWVKSGTVPLYLNRPQGAPMYEYCWERRQRLFDNFDFPYHLNSEGLLDDSYKGIFSYTLPLESWGIEQADELLESWYQSPPEPVFVSLEQMRIADVIFTGFQMETDDYIPENKAGGEPPDDLLFLYNYPNPFNSVTGIAVEGIDLGNQSVLKIHDILGRLVREFDLTWNADRTVVWEGRDARGDFVSSGIYFCKIESNGKTGLRKMLYLR